MSDAPRLAVIERRQEDLIASVHDLCEVMETNNELLREAVELLNAPPSNELAELLKSVVSGFSELSDRVNTLSGTVVQVGGRIGEVPSEVVKLLRT